VTTKTGKVIELPHLRIWFVLYERQGQKEIRRCEDLKWLMRTAPDASRRVWTVWLDAPHAPNQLELVSSYGGKQLTIRQEYA
jgi:hypothetical protein